MIAGKALMDRHAPAELTDTAQGGYDESRALIEKWGRLHAVRTALGVLAVVLFFAASLS